MNLFQNRNQPVLTNTEIPEQAHSYLWTEHMEDNGLHVAGKAQLSSDEQQSRTPVLISHYYKSGT